jgi:hypothetical protein
LVPEDEERDSMYYRQPAVDERHFGKLSILAAKAVETPLILQFIKDVLTVYTFAVEFDEPVKFFV